VVRVPEHDPRAESPEYAKVHHHLIYELDEGCWLCGVRHSTLNDPAQNPRRARQMETHHGWVEWSMANAMDPAKVIRDFPPMGSADDAHLRSWLDSEGNMLVLCDVCHRSRLRGIHSITYPIWVVYRWLRADFDLIPG
jgi:hypothetical protein